MTTHPGAGSTAPTPGAPFAPVRPDHPSAVAVLVLGIISLVAVPFLGPLAWYLGSQALGEIDEQPGRWGGRDLVSVGRVLGIVSTALLLVLVVVTAVILVASVVVLVTTDGLTTP